MIPRGKRISLSIMILSFSTLVARSFAFITTIHLSATLGIDHFGIVVLGTTIFAYTELIVIAGFNTLGSREVARNPAQLKVLAQTIITVRLLLAVLALLILFLFTIVWSTTDLVKYTVLFYGFGLFSSALDLGWVFFGLDAMHIVAFAEIAAQVIMAGSVLLFVRGP